MQRNISILLINSKQDSCLGITLEDPRGAPVTLMLSPAPRSPWELMEDQVVEPCVEVIQGLHDLGGHWHSAWGGPTVSEAYESLLMCTGFLYKGKSQVGRVKWTFRSQPTRWMELNGHMHMTSDRPALGSVMATRGSAGCCSARKEF